MAGEPTRMSSSALVGPTGSGMISLPGVTARISTTGPSPMAETCSGATGRVTSGVKASCAGAGDASCGRSFAAGSTDVNAGVTTGSGSGTGAGTAASSTASDAPMGEQWRWRIFDHRAGNNRRCVGGSLDQRWINSDGGVATVSIGAASSTITGASTAAVSVAASAVRAMPVGIFQCGDDGGLFDGWRLFCSGGRFFNNWCCFFDCGCCLFKQVLLQRPGPLLRRWSFQVQGMLVSLQPQRFLRQLALLRQVLRFRQQHFLQR